MTHDFPGPVVAKTGSVAILLILSLLFPALSASAAARQTAALSSGRITTDASEDRRPLTAALSSGRITTDASEDRRPLTAARVLTLDDSVRLATINAPRILSAEQDTIIAEQRVREAWFQFLPEVGLQASASKFDSRYPFALASPGRSILAFPGTPENLYSSNAYMYLPLYEGRRHVNTLHLAQAAHKAARSNYSTVRREVAFTVAKAFYRLILAQERFEAARSTLRAARALAADPSLDAWNRVEAEALLGEARTASATADHELELSRLGFLQNLNLEFNTAFRVEGDLETKALEVDIDKAIVWAMELRPELQSQTYMAEMDAISVNLAIGRRHPTLFFSGDYELTGHKFPLRQNNWDATLGIKIPLAYDFFSQVQQKKAEQRQGALKRAEIQDRVRLEVRQAYGNLLHWQQEYPLRQAHYERLQSLYSAASKLPGSPLAKIMAAKRLADARLAHLESAAEHIIAVAKLEWAMGRELER